jgi:hypothetical protein
LFGIVICMSHSPEPISPENASTTAPPWLPRGEDAGDEHDTLATGHFLDDKLRQQFLSVVDRQQRRIDDLERVAAEYRWALQQSDELWTNRLRQVELVAVREMTRLTHAVTASGGAVISPRGAPSPLLAISTSEAACQSMAAARTLEFGIQVTPTEQIDAGTATWCDSCAAPPAAAVVVVPPELREARLRDVQRDMASVLQRQASASADVLHTNATAVATPMPRLDTVIETEDGPATVIAAERGNVVAESASRYTAIVTQGQRALGRLLRTMQLAGTCDDNGESQETEPQPEQPRPLTATVLYPLWLKQQTAVTAGAIARLAAEEQTSRFEVEAMWFTALTFGMPDDGDSLSDLDDGATPSLVAMLDDLRWRCQELEGDVDDARRVIDYHMELDEMREAAAAAASQRREEVELRRAWEGVAHTSPHAGC